VVKSGDQLSRIATTFGVTVAAIQAANNIENPNLIRVGQKLIIPLPVVSPAP
jgi:LysM repeat protein